MILGSQNLDTLSWTSSRELGLAIDDAETTGKFDRAFDEMWERSPVAFDQPDCGPSK
jgi:phosphatidylserine/phosphatidylglycerophosphate/cardiolipin synthase-like enzyme